MKKILILLYVLTQVALATHDYPERHYQQEWCNKWHGAMEYKLADKTRVDCVTKNYAVEFDFASKWAESIGQSLYYAKLTEKKPAIILIIEKPSDFRHYDRAKVLAEDYGIKLWYMKSPLYNPDAGYKKEDDTLIAYALDVVKKQVKMYLKEIGVL